MSESIYDGDEDLADDLFAVVDYIAASPELREFKPWHRPRKQFVRLEQWCNFIKRKRSEWDLEDSPIRYLTLPGADLLDIHLIHDEVCLPDSIGLRFLGFDSSANPGDPGQTDLNTTLYEVRRLEHVDSRSDVVGDDIRTAANPQSVAFQKLKGGGAYHVINLDLCNGFAADGEAQTHMPNMFDLISVLFDLQGHSLLPSLLFLTTRTNADSGDAGSIEKLFQAAVESLKICPTYAVDMSRHMQVSDEEALRQMAADPQTFEDVFLISMFTWMLKLALSSRLELTLENVVCYKVHPGSLNTDMASIVFGLTPILGVTEDVHGLTSNRYPFGRNAECKLLRSLVYPTKNRRDIDLMLEQDSALLKEMTESSARLLTKVRYSPEEYLKWAEDGCM